MPPKLDEPIPAIAYIRVSMAREEMISPELQEKAIRDWAKRNGRRIIRIISDLDKTGRNFKRRVQQAIQGVRDGEAREIIVWKFSRFGRNRLGWAVHLDLVESAGGDLVSATEEVDAKTAAGRFTRGMLAEVAAFESDRASEQWKETLDWRFAHGLPKHGHKQWGYIRKGRLPIPGDKNHYRADLTDPLGERYEPDPDLREIYASLYKRYVSGDGGPTLVAWLNHRGITTTTGGPWNTIALYRALDSGFAAGKLREHKADCTCKHPTRCRNVTYHPGAQPAIIDEDLWRRYLDQRDQRAGLPPRSRTPKYALSGLLRCGGCRWLMTTISGPRGGAPNPAYAYRCGRWGQVPECTKAYMRRSAAEDAVLAELATWADRIEAEAATLKPRVVAVAPDVKPDTDKIAADIRTIDKALVRLRKMRALDDDDDEQAEREYRETRKELLTERAEHEARLAAAQQEEKKPRTMADCGPIIAGLLAEWDLLTPGEKQQMLRSLIRAVYVHRTGHRTPPRYEIVPVWADETA